MIVVEAGQRFIRVGASRCCAAWLLHEVQGLQSESSAVPFVTQSGVLLVAVVIHLYVSDRAD